MYNEQRSSNRTEWKYAYKGKELLPYAQKRLTEHAAAEIKARQTASDLLADRSFSRNDPKIKEAEGEIIAHGDAAEKCRVWVYQFRREPDREFQLALGDVVDFELTEESLP